MDIFFKYQKEWNADCAKVKVAVKSRRIGLTWAEAADAVIHASAEKTAGGCNYLYISTREDLAKEFVDTCAEWALALSPIVFGDADRKIPQREEKLLDDEGNEIKAQIIEFASGFKIYGLTSNPANMRGMQGIVCIDEAAHQKNLSGLLKAAMAMLMWGGKVRIISTHHGETNPFNKLVKDIKKGRLNFSLHEIDIKHALSDGLYKRICLVERETWTQEKEDVWLEELVASYGEHAAEELFCQPSSLSGQFFTRSVIEDRASLDYHVLRFICSSNFIEKSKEEQTKIVDDWLRSVVDVYIRSLLSKNYKTYAGLDFGRFHDLTVLSILVEDVFKVRFVPLILELRNCPFHCQAQIVKFVLSRFKKFKKASFDATGNGSFLAEEMALAFGSHRIEKLNLSTEIYLDRFPKYKSALESGDISIPDDEDVIDDHLSVQIINGVPKVPNNIEFKGQDNLPRHGDAAISLMLAWSAAPPLTKKVRKHIWKPHSYYDYGLK